MNVARKSAKSTRLRLLLVALATAVVAAVLVMFYGASWGAELARRQARRELDRWALSQAERWLGWAVRLEPDAGQNDLLLAVCYRRWGQMPRWREAMEAAEAKQAAQKAIELEVGMSMIRSGEQYGWIEGARSELLEAGVPVDDIATTYLDRYLALGDYATAQKFLADWQQRYPDRPHIDYLWGFLWLQLKDYEQANAGFRKALGQEPQHELARKMVAELLEMQGKLVEAAAEHAESLRRAPTSRVAMLGLARTLRKMNRPEAARQLLDPLIREPNPLPVVVYELGQLRLETDEYAEARQQLGANVEDVAHEQLISASIAASLAGEPRVANKMIERNDRLSFEMVRRYDLQLRLMMDPQNRQAAAALQQLAMDDAEPENLNAESPAPTLYAQHCSVCHGSDGRADGRASRHLFPPARNFRAERFRLVSGEKGIVTLADIESVIANGIPGTSMPAFQELRPGERRELAERVLDLHREGLRERYRETLEAAGEEVDAHEVEEYVRRLTTADPLVVAPSEGELSDDAVTRGAEIYQRRGCIQCHGAAGRPDAADPPLYDESGRPSWPRDLVYDPYKGGQSSDAIGRRLKLGMPGTPHPANLDLSDADLQALIAYCRSLGDSPKQPLTNYLRWVRANRLR